MKKNQSISSLLRSLKTILSVFLFLIGVIFILLSSTSMLYILSEPKTDIILSIVFAIIYISIIIRLLWTFMKSTLRKIICTSMILIPLLFFPLKLFSIGKIQQSFFLLLAWIQFSIIIITFSAVIEKIQSEAKKIKAQK